MAGAAAQWRAFVRWRAARGKVAQRAELEAEAARWRAALRKRRGLGALWFALDTAHHGRVAYVAALTWRATRQLSAALATWAREAARWRARGASESLALRHTRRRRGEALQRALAAWVRLGLGLALGLGLGLGLGLA